MRERLIELLLKLPMGKSESEVTADYLLENGVIVLPCKVGDMVSYIDISGVEQRIKMGVIDEIQITKYGNAVVIKNEYTNLRRACMFECIGKTVFTTREAAENALKEREKA